jgi:amino acid adenylation domain-containing protein
VKRERVHNLFSMAAERLETAVAVDYGGRRIQYRELEEKSNNLANFLIASGARKGLIVAILVEDGIEMITAIIAILKAGCIFVPLDSKLPEIRLASMVEEVSAKWFIVESRFFNRIPRTSGAKVICVDTGEGANGSREDLICLSEYSGYCNVERPDVRTGPDDMCYVYFTSGSTDRPKGIAGRLKAIDHFISWEIETFGIKEGIRVSQLTSPSFDAYLRDIFVPLCVGGTVCGLKGVRTSQDVESLIDWIDLEEINLVHCVPSLFRTMLSFGLKPHYFSSLKHVLLAGEPVLPSDVRKWTDTFGDRIHLVNMYGPSETTMTKLYYLIKPHDSDRRSIPIGKPMPGAKAMVVGSDGKTCPPGTVGEIYIRTPFRSLGYYNRPELTSEAFIPNPFTGDPDDLIYKTGDLGRVLDDGNFEFLGRKDEQVKIKGIRVELREIEDLLLGHESVNDVVVIDRDDALGNKYLCAYVECAEETDASILKDYLATRLPDYLVPSMFVMMVSLPRTITGKIDRRALPSIDQARAAGSAYLAPRTQIEEVIYAIWSQVLNLEKIGIEENFFDIGGHSLMATQAISRVKAAFEVELPLQALFESPTVRRLAEQVESALREGGELKAPPMTRADRSGRIPLSFAQQRLWFIDQLEPGNSVYICLKALRMEGRLNLEALESAINEIVRRHEALRTRIEVEEGEPVQVIDEWQPRNLEVEDLRRLGAEEREEEVRRKVREEARTGFDLRLGPLIRIKVLKLGEEDHVVLCTMHHIVSDAWSMGVLAREICALYQLMNEGKGSPLPELAIQYADYACWQRQYLTGAILERHLAYWKKQLSGKLPELDLPTDYPRPSIPSYRGATKSFLLSAELSQSLRSLIRREGVTLYMLLLAAFKTLLYRYTAQEDIIIGTSAENRNRAEIEPLIGFFVNTLPMRTDLSGNPTFRELLKRVKDVALGGYAHQDLPFEKLVEEIQPERSVRQMPLFNVAFGVQNAPREDLKLRGIEVKPVVAEQEGARFDLALWITEDHQQMQVSWIYSKDLFEAETVIHMHDHFETLLSSIVDRPDARLTNLDISPWAKIAPNSQGPGDREDSDIEEPKSIKRRGISLFTEPV